jgi:MraZ protein
LFLGTYEHAIDPKGRLFIPAKLRDANGLSQKKFILTQGLENCLYLFEPSTFHNVLVSKLGTMPVKNQQDGRAFKRLLLSGAHEVELDDMGRVLIPSNLMDFAKLKKSVSILGVGERIELWSTEKWSQYTKKAGATFQKLGKHLEI